MPPPVRFRAAPMSACLNFHLTASKFSTPFPKNLAGCIYFAANVFLIFVFIFNDFQVRTSTLLSLLIGRSLLSHIISCCEGRKEAEHAGDARWINIHVKWNCCFFVPLFCKKFRKLMLGDEIFLPQLRILCIKLTLLILLINFPRTSTWYQQWAQNHIRILLLKRSRAVKNIIFNFFLCPGYIWQAPNMLMRMCWRYV